MSNSEFTKILLTEMQALLKPEGYRRRGQLFEKEGQDLVYLIGLQKSRSSTSLCIKATVNIGIWIKALAPLRAGTPERPSEVGAQMRWRIGGFAKTPGDIWWLIETEPEARKAAKEIGDLLSKAVLPGVYRINSLNDIARQWSSGSGSGLTDYQREIYLAGLEKVL